MGRGIALLFHDRGTRRGWVVSSTPLPHFTPGKDPVPILQEAGWAQGPVWTGRKSRPHRDSIPDRPARSQSLYRLSYRAHKYTSINVNLSSRKIGVQFCFLGATAHIGSRPPFRWGFYIQHNWTHPVGLRWRGDQLVGRGRYLHNIQQTQQSNTHALSGIRIHVPSHQASAELRLRASVSQPSGSGPVLGPGVNYTGPREVLLELITNLNAILYLSTCHTVHIIVLILFMIMP